MKARLGKWRHEGKSGQRKSLEKCRTITSNIQLCSIVLAARNDGILQIKPRNPDADVSSSSLLLSSLELSDTQVYEPQIRALLGTSRS